MVACKACGKKVATEAGGIGVRERDQAYHIACAPDDLLGDALSEWDAILDRGIKYFVKKYSVTDQKKALKLNRQSYSAQFARMGEALKNELRERKR